KVGVAQPVGRNQSTRAAADDYKVSVFGRFRKLEASPVPHLMTEFVVFAAELLVELGSRSGNWASCRDSAGDQVFNRLSSGRIAGICDIRFRSHNCFVERTDCTTQLFNFQAAETCKQDRCVRIRSCWKEWRRGCESNSLRTLMERKLFIFQNARSAENARNANRGYAAGSRHRPPAKA